MRIRLSAAACGVAVALAVCLPAHAQREEPVQPWELLGQNLGRIYGWPNVMFSVAAVAVTPPLVLWVDEPVQEFFQDEDPLTNTFGHVTLIVGYGIPVVAPLTLYLTGLASGDAELATAGSAAMQAVVVMATVTASLKWLTDRAGPLDDGDPNARHWSEGLFTYSDQADEFNFNPFDVSGSLAWPSGHTGVNMALVSSLVAFYPDEVWLPWVGYPLVLAIGVGMIEGDYHWLSDVVAGGLMGHVIGWQIGKGFRERFDAVRGGERVSAVSVTVSASTNPLGARLSGQF
jgi:membrane-associated phospholipid phosphatase